MLIRHNIYLKSVLSFLIIKTSPDWIGCPPDRRWSPTCSISCTVVLHCTPTRNWPSIPYPWYLPTSYMPDIHTSQPGVLLLQQMPHLANIPLQVSYREDLLDKHRLLIHIVAS